MKELACRIVAQTGIAKDSHRLTYLAGFKDSPDHGMQIDGITGEYDTFQSTLEKSVRCANCFRNIGLKTDDVIIVMAPNHNVLVIPLYAGIYLRIYVACVEMTLGVKEIQDNFQITLSKIIFCQSDKTDGVESAMRNINLDTKIVTFNTGNMHYSYLEFQNKYRGDSPVEEFVKFYETTMATKFPTPFESTLILSPAQWLSATALLILSPIIRYTRIQTPAQVTPEHVSFLPNNYKKLNTETEMYVGYGCTEIADINPQKWKKSSLSIVAVTGVQDDEAGELAVACVVSHDIYSITVQEIKDLLKSFVGYGFCCIFVG
ncbi:uncharacterized protein [Battus philenor]|uniref:uncharacterized protein n=1 Tax=Battus philenor TaxID=42288 RepID=UPI0035D1238C